jgi:transcriptional regulator with XRE-family HTH domain
MAKNRRAATGRSAAPTSPPDAASLGAYLAAIRGVRRLTLREVEEATGGEVSNAYLSQLENNKITRPSPNVLHALARVLSVPYETLMEKAGYHSPATAELDVLRSASPAKKPRPSVFASENLSPEEEEALLEYLAFLRSRKGGNAKA